MAPEDKKNKRKERKQEGAPEWMTTYGDMTTLLLTFFVLLFTTATIDGYELELILAAFPGLGTLDGGQTLEVGPLAELGNTVMTLPSRRAGRALDEAREQAVSLFEPEVESDRVRVTRDERGLVISLAADAFFERESADVNMEEARSVLRNLSMLLRSDAVADRRFRVEGHTDNVPPPPGAEYPDNWTLASARGLAVLEYLVDFGAPEERFQVMSLGEHSPLFDNETPEGRAYNRRVDVIILSEGNL